MKNKKLKICMMILLLGCLAMGKSHAFSHAGNLLEKTRAQEPSFSEIVSAAFRQERLEWSQVLEWQKKMKRAPWLPTLYMGYDRQLRRTNTISITDNISVSSAGVNIGPQNNNEDQSLNTADVLRFRAVWQLDETVFHHATLQMAQQEREISKSRLSLADGLFKIYAERRKLLAQYRLSSGAKKIILREECLALTEKLDALTGGIFAERWWKGR